MIPGLPVTQYIRYVSRRASLVLLLGLGSVIPLYAQSQKPSLPDPVKFIQKYEKVANVVHAVLVDMGYKIELEDRKGGKITTRPYEFITGSLTPSEVEKVAVIGDAPSGSLLKAQYTVEAILEIVSPTETLLTVRTKIEALSRDVDGTEKWVPLNSLGTYERRILGKINAKLLEDGAPESDKKGFWGKKPQPVDQRPTRYPTAPTR